MNMINTIKFIAYCLKYYFEFMYNVICYTVYPWVFNTIYVPVFNTILKINTWFFKIPIVWKLDDIILNRNHCCMCGMILGYFDMDVKVSVRKYRHVDCFNYLNRGSR